MAADLARHLDRALWFSQAGLEPDEWQVRAIRSPSKRQLWNVHRQGGKSTTAALKALAKSQEPGALSLLISPSQRQSAELLRKVVELRDTIPGLPAPIAEAAHRLEFPNSARVISLPSSESTVRGYSKVALLVFDEASRIDDALIGACRPMLAISGGEIVALSTPDGRRGFFWDAWENGGDTWERTLVTVDQCGRIDPDFLEEERRILGDVLYRQEYLCAFVDNEMAAFPSAIIDNAFTAEVRPLW